MARLRLQDVSLPPLPGPLRALRTLPGPAARMIGLLVAVNLGAWAVAGVVLRFFPRLITPAVLSYTLGLRHALDADHISVIDLATRRLTAAGQRPATVGTFFSLGHSTVVIITCVVVAATSGALRDRFAGFQTVGGIIGTAVSAAVLLLLSAGNAWVLWRLVRRLREVLDERAAAAAAAAAAEADADASDDPNPAHNVGSITGGVEEATAGQQQHIEGAGFLAHVLRGMFRLVDRPWKMYPIGFLFGLGFDTSSEVALLGIASLQGAEGTSMWLILVFPFLFTAGMCMLDTTDGALMMTLYTSKAFARDLVAILYYSAVLTGITVVVSAAIGIIQVLSLVQNVADPPGRFWDGVAAVGDNFDIIGGGICGVFVLVGLGSVVLYRPWRRRVDRRIGGAAAGVRGGMGVEAGVPEEEEGLGSRVREGGEGEEEESPVDEEVCAGGERDDI